MLIAFDMDGTLSHDDKSVSTYSIDVLRRLKARGHLLIPCTGRSIKDMPEQLLNGSLCPYGIVGSGSLIFDFIHQKKLFHHVLDDAMIQQVYDLCTIYDVDIDLFSNGEVFTDAYTSKHLERYLQHQSQGFIDRIRELRTVVAHPYRHVKAHHLPVERISIFCADMRERKILIEALCQFPLEITASLQDNIEITAKGVHKGNGLAQLCEHLCIDMKECMMIGDSWNDLSALQMVGHPVAMKNSDDIVLKEIPTVTAYDNMEDGMAKYLEARFLAA